MDGLMIDSERLWEEAWYLGADKLEIGFPKGLYRQLIGLNWETTKTFLREELGKAFPLEELIETAEGEYRRLMETNTLPKTGLYELFEALESKGVFKAVVTSTNRSVAERKWRKIDVIDRLDFSVCGDEVTRGKPDPEPYRRAVEGLGLRAEECLALEDSYNGVRAAHAAGASVIMVPDLLEATDEMRGKCMRIVDTLLDVRSLFLEGSA